MTIDTPQSLNLIKIKRHRNTLFVCAVLAATSSAVLTSQLADAQAALRQADDVQYELTSKNEQLIADANRLATQLDTVSAQLDTVSTACSNHAQEAAQLSSKIDWARPTWANAGSPTWATPASSDCSVDD